MKAKLQSYAALAVFVLLIVIGILRTFLSSDVYLLIVRILQ